MATMQTFDTTRPLDGDPAEHFDVIVIGGGQAGLAMGYYLSHAGVRFVILDDRQRPGDSWRNRWESLRLFTPARYDALPGMKFPAPPGTFPTRDQMADYLEAYAARFDLPIHHGVRVDGLWPAGDGTSGYVVTAGGRRYTAPHVVVATGAFALPRIPLLAGHINSSIRQVNAGEYNTPAMLQDGAVLVVGAGNSGAEIAMEVVRDHFTILVGRHPGHLPIALDGRLAQVVDHGIWFVISKVLTLRTPIGRKLAAGIHEGHSGPIERIRPKDLEQAGVERIEMRMTGVRDGLPMLADGRVLDVANIIWCTGFRLDFSWIHIPVFDEDGYPRHERGVVTSSPGLYFLGLPFIYALNSILVGGVGRDAAYIADRIGTRVRVA